MARNYDLRERLALGAEQLSAPELLALLLGSGTQNEDVVDVAKRILETLGGLRELARAPVAELMNMPSLGMARASRIVAAFQLARHARASTERKHALCGAKDVFAHLVPRIGHLDVEVFWVLALDSRNRVIAEFEIARGNLLGVEVHPREVFHPLIRVSAAAAVVAHNHPSGDPSPSNEDIDLTLRLKEVGEVMGIPIVDHVVVSERHFVSIAETLTPV